MRYQWMLATVALAASGPRAERTSLLHRPAPSAMTVNSMEYVDTYGSTEVVKIWRNSPADILVRGRFLDLSTGAEVRTSSGGTTTQLSAQITERHGGDDTRIVVHISPTSTTPLGTFQVLLHYAVEATGPDKFTVRVFDRGKVDQLRIAEAAEPSGAYLTGRTYTLVATGQRLDNAAFFSEKTGIRGLTQVDPPSRSTVSSTERRYGIRFSTPGVFNIGSSAFFDQNVSPTPSVECPVQCYEGTTSFSFQVVSVPIFSSVSSRTPNAGTAVTISGSSMVIPGLTATLRGRHRYDPPFDFSQTLQASNESLVFAAPANMRQDSLRIEYRPTASPSAAPTFTINLPTIAVQGGAPQAVLLDSLGGIGTARKILVAGQRSLVGRFLAPNNLISFTLTQPIGNIGTIPTSPTPIAPPAIAAPSSPTISFGQNTLETISSRYDPTATFRTSGVGADLVSFGMIGFGDTIVKNVTVATPFGSATIPNVLFVPTPTITFIRRRVTGGQTVAVTDGRLFKGSTYEIGGIGLIIPAASGGTAIHSATVRLNGQQLTLQPITTTPGSPLVFSVPLGATSGPLTAQTVAGTTAPLAMTVENLPTPAGIAGFQVSPADVVGGATVTGTVAFNAAIPAGTSIGTLVVTQSASGNGLLTLPGPRAIGTNPVTFTMATRVTRTLVATTVTVVNADASSTTGNSANATVRILPPAPTAVTLSSATVAGGSPVTATVQMSGSAVPSDSIFITLTNTDPTTATVPASVTLNGSAATIQIPTQIVPSVRTVTIAATSGGQTRSATLTVNPPSVASVTPSSSSVIGSLTVPVAVALSSPIPVAQTATISCSGEGLTCPSSVSVSGTGGTFNVQAADVPSARTATITVTLNGVARSGTLEIRPLALQSMTASPATVAAGASSSLTLQLNRTGSATFQLTSSDPTVVIPPSTVTFNGGQVTQFVTIPTRAPQTQSKTVTITATGTHTTSFGVDSITKTVTLTVTP